MGRVVITLEDSGDGGVDIKVRGIDKEALKPDGASPSEEAALYMLRAAIKVSNGQRFNNFWPRKASFDA